MEYRLLFTPQKIGGLQIKNRIVMAPMHMGLGTFDGTPTQKMIDYYEARAKGGAGLIVSEITRVNDITGASAFAQLGISHDYQIKPLASLAHAIKKHGAKFFVQLHHPGRQNIGLMMGTIPMCIAANKVFKGFPRILYKVAPTAGKALLNTRLLPKSVAPSKCQPSYFSGGRVRGLTKTSIKRLVNQFALAAERVMLAGCDGIVLHAAHGYLIQQFLSPHTNKRQDEYGGDLMGRMKFLLDIIKATREKVGDFPIVVRLSVDECYDKIGKPDCGYDLNEGVKMAKILEEAGIDAIDVSSAAYDTFNYWLEPASFENGWRKYMAKAVKEAVKIPVIAANLIRSGEQAEAQLEEGIQDFVSFGRPFIADPDFPNKIKNGEEDSIKRCINCLYCFESMQHNAYFGDNGKCSINPFVGREAFELKEDGADKSVVIIGAGVAGIKAAELLARRKFKVTILEKEKTAGGQVAIAACEKAKKRIGWCVEDILKNLKALNVDIVYGAEATQEIIDKYNPYAVIFATGASPIVPSGVSGITNQNVVQSVDIYDKKIEIKGKNVLVVGGGITGLGTAAILCGDNDVIVADKETVIAKGAWMQHVDELLPKLTTSNVKFKLGYTLSCVDGNTATLKSIKNRKCETIEADYVVLSMGVKPQNQLYNSLKDKYKLVFNIGDSRRAGRIAFATEDAFNVAKEL